MQVKSTKKTLLLAGILVFGLMTSGFIINYSNNQPKSVHNQENIQTFNDEKSQLTLKFDQAKLEQITLNQKDQTDKVVFRAQEHGGQPSFLISLRYETGLKLVANLTKQKLTDIISQNLRKSYPSRYKQFNEVSSRKFVQNNHDCFEIIFTYEINSQKVKQRFIAIDINGDNTGYLSMQSQESEFDSINSHVFEKIATSLNVGE